VDVASIRLESDLSEGYGWQIGALHKVTDRFSWGFSYRSKIEVDYDGDARFTQIATIVPALDAQIAASLPFDQDLPVKTKIEFPDSASLGLAYVVVPQVLMELDVNWTGWSSFDTLPIDFTTVPALSFERPENWDDVYSYRFGVRWDAGTDTQWRFGFVYDESPQPTESVSPLLPDSDRNGYTVGWGRHGSRFDVDLALMYLDFEARTNDRSIDGFNGTYSQTGWLFGATLGF